MNRESEALLLQFCAAQNQRFDARSWRGFSHPRRDEFIAATLFLAGVDWYGHASELCVVAESLQPGCTGHLSSFVSRSGFDCSRFSNMLRRALEHALVAP